MLSGLSLDLSPRITGCCFLTVSAWRTVVMAFSSVRVESSCTLLDANHYAVSDHFIMERFKTTMLGKSVERHYERFDRFV